MLSSSELTLNDINNRISPENVLSHITLDTDDYEIRSATIFSDSNYATVENLESPLSEKRFNILNLNIQSLTAKFDALTLLLHQFEMKNIEISAICLQETWLNEIGSDLDIDGYQTFSLRKTCGGKGGLVIYLKNDFEGSVIDSIYQPSEMFEALTLELNTGFGNNKIALVLSCL